MQISRRFSLAGVALVSIGLLSACGKSEKVASPAAAPTESVRPVRSVIAQAQTPTNAIVLPGDVRARNEQRLGFRVGGKMVSRRVEVGDLVKPGQILATLDGQDVAPQIRAQAANVEAAKANTKWQSADLKRQQDLRDKGFISAAAMQRQELNLETAQAQERAAAASLANAQNAATFQTLSADRAGVVVGIDAEVGSVVAAGQTVFRIAQVGEREVVVNVPERAVAGLKSTPSVAVKVDALGAEAPLFPAKLRELSPTADATTRTFLARFSLMDAPDTVKLGMTATVVVGSQSASAIVLPLTAVATRDGQPRVWRVDDKALTVEPVNITTGALAGDGIVITSGVKAGERIVTAGANLLTPGQKVRLEVAIASAPSSVGAPK
jgi:membrane fusion protein, multidrug efflux system